jgi:hypothetical protein
MPDEKIEVNYVRWRLGNSYKCKELLASFLTALSLIYAFYLIAVSPPPAQKQAASIRIPAVISDVRNVSENTSFHQRNNTKSVEQVSTCLREFWLQVSVQPLQQGQGQAKQPLPSRCP